MSLSTYSSSDISIIGQISNLIYTTGIYSFSLC